jgi:hypothetical protein
VVAGRRHWRRWSGGQPLLPLHTRQVLGNFDEVRRDSDQDWHGQDRAERHRQDRAVLADVDQSVLEPRAGQDEAELTHLRHEHGGQRGCSVIDARCQQRASGDQQLAGDEH